MDKRFDILVAGAENAGVVADIQAARAVCKSVLVEKNAMSGGTMTAGGIAFLGLFYTITITKLLNERILYSWTFNLR